MALQKAGWAKVVPRWSPTLKGLKQIYSIYPSLENFKVRGRGYNEKPDQQSFGAAVRPVNQVKD